MPRVLIADDNSNIQKMVTLALKDAGIDVVAVANGEAAVRKLAELPFDLVLADIFMPVRSGYEVCEYVKLDKRFSQIPVVLLVGAFDPFDEHESQRVRADGVLKKPFVPPDPLTNMVKTLLAKVAAEREPVAAVPVFVSTSSSSSGRRDSQMASREIASREQRSRVDAQPAFAPEPQRAPVRPAARALEPPIAAFADVSSSEFAMPGASTSQTARFTEREDVPAAVSSVLELPVIDAETDAVSTTSRDPSLGEPAFWTPTAEAETAVIGESDVQEITADHSWGAEPASGEGSPEPLPLIEPLIGHMKDPASDPIGKSAEDITEPGARATVSRVDVAIPTSMEAPIAPAGPFDLEEKWDAAIKSEGLELSAEVLSQPPAQKTTTPNTTGFAAIIDDAFRLPDAFLSSQPAEVAASQPVTPVAEPGAASTMDQEAVAEEKLEEGPSAQGAASVEMAQVSEPNELAVAAESASAAAPFAEEAARDLVPPTGVPLEALAVEPATQAHSHWFPEVIKPEVLQRSSEDVSSVRQSAVTVTDGAQSEEQGVVPVTGSAAAVIPFPASEDSDSQLNSGPLGTQDSREPDDIAQEVPNEVWNEVSNEVPNEVSSEVPRELANEVPSPQKIVKDRASFEWPPAKDADPKRPAETAPSAARTLESAFVAFYRKGSAAASSERSATDGHKDVEPLARKKADSAVRAADPSVSSAAISANPVGAPAAAPLTAEAIEGIVTRVVERMQPKVIEVVTREILRPLVEALVRREMGKR